MLTGDYLLVSKMSYGPRIPNTPVHMPLTAHTIPLLNIKSFVDWPQWDYRRVKGFGEVQQNDIVVFNYPSGDTVATKVQEGDYYSMCYEIGEQLCPYDRENLSPEQRFNSYKEQYETGRNYIIENADKFGEIISRPVDMRDNYVKRCVGMPGQWLKIRDGIIYTDNHPNKTPDMAQKSYIVTLKYDLPEDFCKENNITFEDRMDVINNATTIVRRMPLTKSAYYALLKRTDLVISIEPAPSTGGTALYPHNMLTRWTCDNYGPIWIPKKGHTVQLSIATLPIYQRPIEVYEHNQLEVRDGKIFINGIETNRYTFKMDYYWMMGDNRDYSADSRFWGFVPEDHIVGKPIIVWMSLNKDYGWFDGKIRWDRFFRLVDNIK